MAQWIDELDPNYFKKVAQSQAVNELRELQSLMAKYNKLLASNSQEIALCMKTIEKLPSDKDLGTLSPEQLKDLDSTIQSVNRVQMEVSKKVKKPSKNKEDNANIKKVWNQIEKTAISLGKYRGYLSGTTKKSDFIPTALTRTHIDKDQRGMIGESQQNQQKSNYSFQKKLQAIHYRSIVPPLPPSPTPSTTAPPVNQSQSSTDPASIIDVFMKVLDSVSKGIQQFGQALGQFTSQVGKAYATMMSAFGSILDSPLEATVGIIGGMAQMIQQGYQLIGGFIKTLFDIFSSILSIFIGGDDDKEGGKSNPVAKILEVVTQIVSAIINVVIQQIQAGFSIFASTLEAVFKIVKKIQETSPIVRAILDLLNLAFTLFFMPFMNQFALVLLDTVLELLDWAIEKGDEFAELGLRMKEILEESGFSIDDILEQVMDIAEKFVTDFLPLMLELLPDVIDFALAFANTIVDNKDDLLNFIQSGLDAFKEMLETGMLTTFLKFGQDTMKWVQKNAVTIVDFLGKLLNQALNIAQWFMGFLGGPQAQLKTVQEEFEMARTELTNKLLEINIDDMGVTKAEGSYATGGIFPKTMNRGIPILAGEGGEDEYRLNERELEEIGKDTTVTVQYNGSILSKNDFKQVIRNTVSDISNKSYFR